MVYGDRGYMGNLCASPTYLLQKEKSMKCMWDIDKDYASKRSVGTSLVVQCLRMYLPIQGTWFLSLLWEDTTRSGACTLEPMLWNYWAHKPQLLKTVHPRACAPQQKTAKVSAVRSPSTTMKSSPCWLQVEKSHAGQQRLHTAKIKIINKKFKVKYYNRGNEVFKVIEVHINKMSYWSLIEFHRLTNHLIVFFNSINKENLAFILSIFKNNL